jgi:hypothetical protein
MIILGSLGGLLVLGLIMFFMVTSSSTRVAFLNIEAGEVLVDQGNGWETAANGMKLALEDRIKTGQAIASVVLYESAVISLSENTEIAIADLNKQKSIIKQVAGSTWNKFTGLSGLKGLEIETPTTVATVRGTEFRVTMNGVYVGEGDVLVTDKATGDSFEVGAGKKAIYDEEGNLIVEYLSPDELREVIGNMKLTLDRLKNIRNEEIDKHPTIVGVIKRTYGLSDQDIQRKLEDVDAGRLDEDELKEKSPIKAESIDKFVEMTKEIKKQQSKIQELEDHLSSQ